MRIVPMEAARREITVVNSRFIASLSPVSSHEQARAFLASIRAEFPDARHHVPAWIIGGGASVGEFCSDDGEPSGTAGRPLLAVLKGSLMGDIAVVVTRYFGGTLLGTGGLVKAYSQAGKLVTAAVRRASLVPSTTIGLHVPYEIFDRVRRLLVEAGATIAHEDFAESVGIEATIADGKLAAFSDRLAELSSGALVPAIIAHGEMKAAREDTSTGGRLHQ